MWNKSKFYMNSEALGDVNWIGKWSHWFQEGLEIQSLHHRWPVKASVSFELNNIPFKIWNYHNSRILFQWLYHLIIPLTDYFLILCSFIILPRLRYAWPIARTLHWCHKREYLRSREEDEEGKTLAIIIRTFDISFPFLYSKSAFFTTRGEKNHVIHPHTRILIIIYRWRWHVWQIIHKDNGPSRCVWISTNSQFVPRVSLLY